jgi:hypothetical protein
MYIHVWVNWKTIDNLYFWQPTVYTCVGTYNRRMRDRFSEMESGEVNSIHHKASLSWYVDLLAVEIFPAVNKAQWRLSKSEWHEALPLGATDALVFAALIYIQPIPSHPQSLSTASFVHHSFKPLFIPPNPNTPKPIPWMRTQHILNVHTVTEASTKHSLSILSDHMEKRICMYVCT